MSTEAPVSEPSTCSRHGRRVFLCRLGLAATAGALAGCEFSEIYENSAQTGATLDFDVSQATYTALATVGGKQVVTVGGAKVLLIRVADDQVVAFGASCPHAGNPLDKTGVWDSAAQTLRCKTHGAIFGVNGQPTNDVTNRALMTYKVEFTNPIGKVTT